ncbi:hypothetical protein [Psychroserpens sp.]|uniref:hypothetical protein n=1 Tax=Psychroserpens sp. TaxID=2020870 RepID=UPI002B26F893|nr:hypothetical protein [Psychroserpens sp.]
MKRSKTENAAQLRKALEKKITVKSLKENGMKSRKEIMGFRRGYKITQEALNHSYDARIGNKL